MPKLSRPQRIVLPILRACPDLEGVKIGTWVEDIDYRTFPLINIRRVGGFRHKQKPTLLANPVVEMTAYGVEGLPETEDLYETALEALFEAVRKQTLTDYGYLHSIKETFGATQFGSLFQDSWRIQGLIQLGIRPPRPADLLPVAPTTVPDPVSFFDFTEGSGASAASSVGGYTLSAYEVPNWVPEGGITQGAFAGQVGPGGARVEWSASFEVEIGPLPIIVTSLWHQLNNDLWFNIDQTGHPGPWPPDQFGAIALVPGEIHIVTMVCTPIRTMLYVDGELSRAFPFSYSASWLANPVVLMDSSRPDGSTMYSARFWDVALTPSQVAEL